MLSHSSAKLIILWYLVVIATSLAYQFSMFLQLPSWGEANQVRASADKISGGGGGAPREF